MINYSDIDPRINAFVFELDNVLFPEKDYLYQVYYLFAGYLEYTELLDAKVLVSLMVSTYEQSGASAVFDTLQERFKLDEKYRFNFEHLHTAAQVPLMLFIYPEMLKLLQDIVVDRKQIFILTNGNPQQQLNKIKHTDWQGLEKYLTCYFAEEIASKPEPDALHFIIEKHHLQRREIMMIGASQNDELCAEAAGVDYISV
ncbi:HAD hydrolase-like protein [Mucilaginibacter sp. CSA2-8R]|uniref:HAD family hydrolase n=1 Tax=Mucilaginibacter sp. CSA2-8R TaxID=3141542 RepID=UPI00315D5F57